MLPESCQIEFPFTKNSFCGMESTILHVWSLTSKTSPLLSKNIFDFSMCQLDNADTNFDGVINILDIISLVNLILSSL